MDSGRNAIYCSHIHSPLQDQRSAKSGHGQYVESLLLSTAFTPVFDSTLRHSFRCARFCGGLYHRFSGLQAYCLGEAENGRASVATRNAPTCFRPYGPVLCGVEGAGRGHGLSRSALRFPPQLSLTYAPCAKVVAACRHTVAGAKTMSSERFWSLALDGKSLSAPASSMLGFLLFPGRSFEPGNAGTSVRLID